MIDPFAAIEKLIDNVPEPFASASAKLRRLVLKATSGAAPSPGLAAAIDAFHNDYDLLAFVLDLNAGNPDSAQSFRDDVRDRLDVIRAFCRPTTH